MNIGQVSEASGLTPKAIRHYESLGLVVPNRQVGNAYRQYSLQDLDDLRLLQRARSVGFNLSEAGQLLKYCRDPDENNRMVQNFVTEKLKMLDRQWFTLNMMRQTLTEMAAKSSQHNAQDGEAAKQIPEKPVMAFTLVEVSNEQ